MTFEKILIDVNEVSVAASNSQRAMLHKRELLLEMTNCDRIVRCFAAAFTNKSLSRALSTVSFAFVTKCYEDIRVEFLKVGAETTTTNERRRRPRVSRRRNGTGARSFRSPSFSLGPIVSAMWNSGRTCDRLQTVE